MKVRGIALLEEVIPDSEAISPRHQVNGLNENHCILIILLEHSSDNVTP